MKQSNDLILRSEKLGLTLVPMSIDDLASVIEIESQLFNTPWSLSMFRHELDQKNRKYFSAKSLDENTDSLVIGYGGYGDFAQTCHIVNIGVTSNYQRRGVGSSLLCALLIEAMNNQIPSATLEVREANHEAQRLYARFGFAPVGIRPRYYQDTNEDALIMWIHDLNCGITKEKVYEYMTSVELRSLD